MKKLYCALAVAALAMSANAADYYMIGGFNGWSLKDDKCLFTDQGDGTYVLDYDGTLISGFKINDGTWSNDNANFGSNGSKLEIDKVYNLNVAGTSGNIEMDGNIANPHIVFNPSEKTLLITGQPKEATYSYCLWGQFKGTDWSALDLTEKEGKWVSAETTITRGNFGIKKLDEDSGDQVDWWSSAGDAAVVLNTAMPLKVEGTNFSIDAGTYVFTLDPEAMTLTVTGEGGDDPNPPTPADYTGWYLNVQGEFNAWTPQGVAFNADGTVEAKNLAIGAGEFELKIWNGSADSYWGNASATIVSGEAVEVFENGGHMTISGATADSVYDVTYNAVDHTMVVTLVGGGDDPNPPAVDYTTWYVNVLGTFNDWKDNGVPANAEGIAEHKDLAIGTGEFKVKVWNGGDLWLGNGEAIVPGEPTVVKTNTGNMTISGAAEGDIFDVTFDCATSTLTVTKVEAPVEEGKMVYNDGEIALGVNSYGWYAAGMDFLAENPTGGDTKVYSFKADNGGPNASMGLFADGKQFVTGNLNSATLNYKWYAAGSAKCTIRVTADGGAEENFNWTVNEENAGKWNSTSIPVAETFPTVAAQWKDFQGKGAGYVFAIVLEEASEDFCIYFDNINYTNLDETWVAPELPEIVPPTSVPAVEQPKDEVLSIFSEYGNNAFGIGGWGQSTQYEVVTIDNKEAAKLTNFNYLGWELNPAVNVKDYKYVHVDFYPCEETSFGFTIISPGQEKAWTASEVKLNEWNSYDVPVDYWTNVDKTNVFQIKFDKGDKVEAYLANVYFYGDASVVTPVEPGNGKTYRYEIRESVEQNGNVIPYYLVMDVTYNEDRTLTIKAKYLFDGDTPVGIVPGSASVNGALHDFVEVDGLRTYTTAETFNAGDVVTIGTYIPIAYTVLADSVQYTVGSDNLLTGIEIVGAEESASYFTLDGIRVEKPVKGLYIKVQNGKSSKVVVK